MNDSTIEAIVRDVNLLFSIVQKVLEVNTGDVIMITITSLC